MSDILNKPLPTPPTLWEQIEARVRQPSTLVAIGLAIGAVVYWVTKDPGLTLLAASIVPGALNDHTRDVLQKVESLEDGLAATRKLVGVAMTPATPPTARSAPQPPPAPAVPRFTAPAPPSPAPSAPMRLG